MEDSTNIKKGNLLQRLSPFNFVVGGLTYPNEHPILYIGREMVKPKSLQKTRHLLTWLLFTFFATLAISNVLNFNTLVMGPKKTIKKNKNFSNVSL
jgi:hypothetical protein